MDASSSSTFLTRPLTQQPSSRSPHWLVYPLLGNSTLPHQVDNGYLQEHLLLFRLSVLSVSLWPHGLQHARALCSSLSLYSGLISFRMDWVGSPCCPRDPQESSPAPQFKSINSLVLSLLYGPTLISVHDYWENILMLKAVCVYLKFKI